MTVLEGSKSQHALLAPPLDMPEQRDGGWARVPRVLIVEDDADAGEIFESALEMAGFDAILARTGGEALSLLPSVRPDLILLDLHLPDVMGTDVLRRVRSDPRLAEVPVIVATASPDMAVGISDRVDVVLVKPVRYDVLQAKVIQLLIV